MTDNDAPKTQADMTPEEVIEYVASKLQVESEDLIEAADVVSPVITSVISFARETNHMELILSTKNRNMSDSERANFALNRILMSYFEFSQICSQKKEEKDRKRWDEAREATPEEVKEAEEVMGMSDHADEADEAEAELAGRDLADEGIRDCK